MRLIDADKLKVLIAIENDGQMNTGKLITELFNGIEAVEAIPIEFLVNTIPEYSKRYGPVHSVVIGNLIEDWEKENETN